MAFIRSIVIDGVVYRNHRAATIQHHLGGGTSVQVLSCEEADGRGGNAVTWHHRELAEGMTFQAAEEWLKTLDFFAEHEDPAQSALDSVLAILTDEQAETVPGAFPEWAAGIAYAAGTRVRHSDALWRCVQAHTSQEGWEPGNAPSLWSRIGEPGEEWPEWVQPTGGHDAYAKGDKVAHAGKRWTSDIDANAYEPGVYGWTEAA